jgi:glutamine synthetase
VTDAESPLADAKVVHLAIPDTSGTLRQKRFPAARSAAMIEAGWSFIEAVQWWDSADGLYADGPSADSVSGNRGWTHAPAVADPASARPFPFEPDAAVLLADFTGPAGELSPRRLAQRLTERLAALGLTARLAFEIEVILLDGTSDDQAADGYASPRGIAAANRCWSGVTLASHAPVLASLDATLASGGVQLDHLCAELGPGCIELATSPRSPVVAADDLAFLKLYTKAWAHQSGYTATFMAKLAEEFPGLGCHPVLTLHDAAIPSDEAIPSDAVGGDGEHGLTKTGLHAVAGILAVLPDLTVLAAPTVNSYRRLTPGNWAPRTATWGIGNYTCGLRVVPGAASPGDPARAPGQPAATPTRLELRVPGADVNPWLAAALVLAGAVYGAEHELLPPAPVTGPAREVPPGLPRTLLEAAERFAASDIARDLIGEPFISHYAATRAEEDRQLRLLVSPAERARYLDHV